MYIWLQRQEEEAASPPKGYTQDVGALLPLYSYHHYNHTVNPDSKGWGYKYHLLMKNLEGHIAEESCGFGDNIVAIWGTMLSSTKFRLKSDQFLLSHLSIAIFYDTQIKETSCHFQHST